MNCKTNSMGKGHCGPGMNCGCGCGNRRFYSKEEQIEMLERYRDQLKKELQGLDAHLVDLKDGS